MVLKRSVLLVPFLVALAVGAAQAKRPTYLSPVDIVADAQGKTLYVAEATASRLGVLDLETETAGKIKLPGDPSGLALAPDGKRLYVTLGEPAGRVCVVDLASGKVKDKIATGHTPMAPVVSPDGKTLYVCNRFDNAVAVIDIAEGEEVASIPMPREPVASVLTPDGARLVIANHLPAGPADGDYTASVISVIETASRTVAAEIALPNGSTGLRGICLSPDGAYAYATHILARYHLPTTQLERGWMNTNALSVIDVVAGKLVNTVLLDNVDLGAANPWGVACSADGSLLVVAHAGTHEVSVIDRAALHAKLAKVAAGEGVSDVSRTPDDVPNDLSFLVGMRRRLALAGNGPRGVALVGTTVYAAEYFTDSLGVLDVAPETRPEARSIPLGKVAALTPERQGEMYFNDGQFCFQKWQSCATCHPDARADALNWDLLNDGMGTPKNTKSLLLSHRTPPVMVTGIRPDAKTAVRAGLKYIQFAVRPNEDAKAIDAYLMSMEPVQSPYLERGGKLSASAKRGKKTFKQAGCAECHPASLYTDLKTYDVGTGTGREADRKFDSPTLVEVWRTGPLLYDGRSATVHDVLTQHNTSDRHGVTSGLSEKQIDDLAQFVLSQ